MAFLCGFQWSGCERIQAMDAAALIFFALSCGINYGWQPMPDGSQRVEYLVQIEPEMLEALQSGQSVPITSDVADHIGPIGRVRIVIGHNDLPRQKLSTSYKPGSDTRGVEQAQFTTSIGSQSTTSPPLIDPRNLTTQPAHGQPTSSSDPFARALQDSATRIRQSADQVRKSADQILSGQNRGQGIGDRQQNFSHDLSDRRGALGHVGGAVQDTTRAVGDRLQQSGQQIRDTADNLNRSVGEFGNRAREALDKFGRPLRGEHSILSGNSQATSNQNQQSSTLPPAPQLDAPLSEAPRYSGPRYNPQSTLGQSNSATNPSTRMQRLDEPITPGQVGQWESKTGHDDRQPFRGQGTGDRGQGTGGRGELAGGDVNNNRDFTDRRPSSRNIGPPQATVDSWLNQSFINQDVNNQGSHGYNSRGINPRVSDNTLRKTEQLEGPRFPSLGNNSLTNNDPTTAQRPAAVWSLFGVPIQETDAYDQSGTANPYVTNPLTSDSNSMTNNRIEKTITPTIRRDMFAQPADSPVPVDSQPQDRFSDHNNSLEPGDTQPNDMQSIGMGQQNNPTQQTNGQFAQFPPGSNTNRAGQIEQVATSTSSGNKFPLLLAWVLLSGSAAGNLYLFWSYLDVRGKYQAVVRSTRGLSSRFSGA